MNQDLCELQETHFVLMLPCDNSNRALTKYTVKDSCISRSGRGKRNLREQAMSSEKNNCFKAREKGKKNKTHKKQTNKGVYLTAGMEFMFICCGWFLGEGVLAPMGA